ncbi:hypothetical protein CWC11_10845 [Pseudoalteromonas sp. S3178]|uniref:hypothetical protein n=1 Tax=Pseudoalteromonas sp. S3178 TaxID=579532 RepID=UPI00110AEB77|nr:hypothetical protein [Pseudoalteromonas sp. S3178]TMP04864.1 hypothetical protein CWC11_10845 [Pseudoalteromonas sp. S3178]
MESNNEHSNTTDTNEKVEAETQDNHLSQNQLIQQWRVNLASLKKDTRFEVPKELHKSDEEVTTALDAIAYLDKKNTLLDENEDFQLSDNGFATYKAKHMIAFEYLSQLKKPDLIRNSAKFYFFSRTKQVEQLSKPSIWAHSLFHFLITLIVILVLGVISLLVLVKTQDNLFVKLLVGWFWIVNIKAAGNLIGKYKKSAITPFRFSISLLGIHSLNILMKVSLLGIIPFLIVSKYNAYWIDDAIIITLFIICLINFKPDEKPLKQVVEKDLTKVGTANV